MTRVPTTLKTGVSGLALMISPLATNAAYSDESDTDEVLVFEEIIVQARKRDESIEDVPSSVTALSSSAVEDLQLNSVADYIRQIPGGVLVASGPDYLNDIALRGQGGGRLGFSESTTGIYRNGIYVAGGGFGGRSFSRIDFFDLDRMEVYRGPQGALYGRNAVGGAVNAISRKPTTDSTARVRAGYDSVEKIDIEAVVNTPIIEGIGLRIGGYYADQNDGHYKDSVTGEAIDTQNEWGVRGVIGGTISETAELFLTVEHSNSEAPGFATMGQNLTLDPDPFTRVGLSHIDKVKIDQTSVIAELNVDFSASTLTALANFKKRDGVRNNGDLDHFIGFNSSLLMLLNSQAEDFKRHGFEVRLASNSDSAFTWLVGADYQSFQSDITTINDGTISGPFAFSAALRRQLKEDYSTEELKSYSAFALVGYDVSDKLNVSFEARIQVDNKDFVFEHVDTDAFTDETIPSTVFDEKWARLLPTVSLSYKASEELTLYGRVATGYRPGGFNPNPSPGFFERTAYDPEDIISSEVGFKGVYKVGDTIVRPQLALYYSVTNDVQATTALSPTDTNFSLQNVGGNKIYGGEFELTTHTALDSGRLITNFGLSTAQGDFDDGTEVLFQGATVDLSGMRVPRTRDYIMHANVMYGAPISDDLEGFINVSFQAEGGGFDNASHTRDFESYEMLDVNAGIQGENWRLVAYAKNLTNDVYRLVEINNNKFVNTPRTYGVRLSFDW